MKIHPDGKVERTDIWREGAYVDLWSVVHFISGTCLALAMFLLPLSAMVALAVSVFLLIAYELWEYFVQIEETTANRIMDVVVGVASYVPTYFWLAPALTTRYLISLLSLLLIVDAIMSYGGWRASQKAAELEKHMRARWLRMQEIRAQRRLRKQQN